MKKPILVVTSHFIKPVETRIESEYEVRRKFDGTLLTRDELLAAAEDAVRAATEARRVIGDRFSAGVATSTDLLDAQVAVLQAALDRTQALANARLADARLHRAIGQ